MGWARVPLRSSKGLRSLFGWAAFWTGFGVLDALVPVSFSQTIRDVFDTDSPEGRAVFLITLAALTALFAVHIIHKK